MKLFITVLAGAIFGTAIANAIPELPVRYDVDDIPRHRLPWRQEEFAALEARQSAGNYFYDNNCAKYLYGLSDCSSCHQCYNNGSTINSVTLYNSGGTCKSGQVYLSFCPSSTGACSTINTSLPPSGTSSSCVRAPITNAKYIKHFCVGAPYPSPPAGCSSKL